MQNTVDPVSNTEGLRQGLQVNIRRPQFESFYDQGVYQFDQGCISLDGATVGQRRSRDLHVLFGQLLDRLREPRIGLTRSPTTPISAVVFAQRFLDVALRGDLQADLGVQQVGKAIDRVQVRRIGNGDGNAVVVLENRHNTVFTGDMPWDGGDYGVVNLDFGKVDNFGAELSGLGLGYVSGANKLIRHHEVHHPDACTLCFLSCPCDLVWSYESKVNEDVY